VHTSVAELIHQEGPQPHTDVVRWLAEVCDALGELEKKGISSTCDAARVKVSRDPAELALVDPVALDAKSLSPRWQVREVGALGYQMLKGVSPPQPLTDTAFEGIHTELAQLLVQALSGTGPASARELSSALRALKLPSQLPRRNSDTVLNARKSDIRDRTGELFGQYELIRMLGEGGMGDVYLGRHVRLGREVAIKLLKPEFAALPDLVRRFFQEAAVVNEIRHPHIVEVTDFVEEPGRVYCVMELLQGMNLADLHQHEGPLALGRIAFIVVQVCDALHAAHQREVVHRDIKPENIFITRGPDGADFAKVLDFGIARRAASGTATQAGAVMGTPQYMAPEQAAGRPVDARADLYALGVVLFELVSGKTIAEAGDATLPDRDGRGVEVPRDLKALVESLLSLDPKNRPGSADEVRVRLLPYVRTNSSSGLMPGVPVRPRTIPPGAQQATQVAMADAGLKRSYAPVFVLGAVVSLLGGLGYLAMGPSADAARVAPPPAPVVVEKPVAPPPVEKHVEAPPPPKSVEPEPPKPPEPATKKPLERLVKPAKWDKRNAALTNPEPVPAPAVAAVDPRVTKLKTRLESVKSRYAQIKARKKLTRGDHAVLQQPIDEEAQGGIEAVQPGSLDLAEHTLETLEKAAP
jgi:serine/threonine-protein kinase